MISISLISIKCLILAVISGIFNNFAVAAIYKSCKSMVLPEDRRSTVFSKPRKI